MNKMRGKQIRKEVNKEILKEYHTYEWDNLMNKYRSLSVSVG